MNKAVLLGLSMLQLSEILMYEFWNDYVKPKYVEKANLCYTDTDFMACIKTNYIFKDIAEDVETRFDISNYELDHCLKEKNRNVIGLIKEEFGGKIIIKFEGFRAKIYTYLIDDDSEDTKAKG